MFICGLRQQLSRIEKMLLNQQQELKIMAQGITDLETAVTNLQATVAANTAAVNTIIANLQSASGDPDATVESLAQAINTAVASLQTNNSNLQSAVPAPASGAAASTPAAS